MDEYTWLTSMDPEAMFAALPEPASERKCWLFCCACLRRGWGYLPGDPCRAVIEVTERYVDGEADEEEWERARQAAFEAAYHAISSGVVGPGEEVLLARLVMDSFSNGGTRAACGLATRANASDHRGPLATGAVDPAVQAGFLRCIFLFWPASLDPACRTPTAVDLVLAAYTERRLPRGDLAPIRLRILADALEEAGCAPALLAHLRGPGPHVRGCWPIDLVLGRE
jgi:hypothetical protein